MRDDADAPPDVICPGAGEAELSGDSSAPDPAFRWVLNGMRISSTLVFVTPGEEIAWTGRPANSRGGHRFLLRPGPAIHTTVRSEKSIGSALIGLYYSSAELTTVPQGWLGALKNTVEEGK
ncbi:hypothetical protein ACIPJO_29575 [Streptomyces sp. NPDC086993]|uniref:hypothetical protein n=1 Tax=Streptomyces sp. NPDC086993 TaxID=3365765 RepID=UPI0037F95B16